jgi:peroxiredoxin
MEAPKTGKGHMQERDSNTLRYVEQLIQQGKKQDARQMLVAYFKRAPGSAQAWWLLSQLVVEESQQMDCLERVLRLDPDHTSAQICLAKLKRTPDSLASPFPGSPFLYSPEEESPISDPAKESAPAASPGLFANDPGPSFEPKLESLRYVADQPLPTPNVLEDRPPARKKKARVLQIALIMVGLCVGTVAVGYIGMLVLGQKMTLDAQATQVMAQAWTSRPPRTLPPTWTMTATSSPLPSRTPLSTYTPSPTVVLSIPSTNTKASSGLRSITFEPVEPAGPSAPNFTLQDASGGNNVSLSDYRGHPVVLVFWATWCGYCEREMSSLKSVYNSYKDAGLVILAVNHGDSASDVRSYRKSHGLNFTILLDPKKSTAQMYKVTGIPKNVFIDRNGRIVQSVSGMMNTVQLTGMVEVILSE